MFSEFKKFAMQGNMLDMAVGIMIGAAFSAIVGSLVGDILTPALGPLTGNVDFSDMFFVMADGEPAGPYTSLRRAQAAGALTLNYGAFIDAVFNFLIIAGALFLIVRGFNALMQAQADAAEPETDEVLLGEIRDLLRARLDPRKLPRMSPRLSGRPSRASRHALS